MLLGFLEGMRGGVGGSAGKRSFSLICIRASEVPVKLVNCYCLGLVLTVFVYKHWGGCREGREVRALSKR